MPDRLTVTITGGIGWPGSRTEVVFDGLTLTLLPQTTDHAASVHVDLRAGKVDVNEAYTAINRFLSAVAWGDDADATNHGGWAGNHTEGPVSHTHQALGGNWAGLFPIQSPAVSVQRRALSLYREALNAEAGNLPTFAVLGFFRILEMKGNGSQEDARKWIQARESEIEATRWLQDTLERIGAASGGLALNRYLLGKCRVAVAHATKGDSKFDPDDIEEIRRMSDAAEVLKFLAKRFIETELGLGDL